MKNWLATIVAIIALVVYGLLAANMLMRLEDPEVTWSRAVFIFHGVEAIAFAAAGFLFGVQVHRRRAEEAESALASARSDVKDAVEQAAVARTRGAALAAAIRTKAESTGPVTASSAPGEARPATMDLEELDRLARRHFPETVT